ncbi:MAG: WbqC family protein [Saprospiraceae bacterium]|nr:WbqC family protein [Saprospiraceae bacterium]
MHLSTAYLPPVSWCFNFWNASAVELEACEHYQKGSWRNRCQIAGPNGPQLLSIPLVKGKHNQLPIREVRIAYDEPWQRQHWRSIKTAYGNAPFFEHYTEELQPFYEKRFDFLFDFNLELMEWLLIKKMNWQGKIQFTKEFEHSIPLAVAPSIRYPQVFEEKNGFLPDLSVLDLLMCAGKSGNRLLTHTGST